MSLQDILNRIKPQQIETVQLNLSGEVEHFPLFQKLFLSITIILVALLSFGLGRLSMTGNREPIRIEYDPTLTGQQALDISQSASVIKATKKIVPASNNNIEVVVSKNGIRYHYPYCAGAKQIKEENKIVFPTAAAAEAAGYTLAANCKPR
ncbi:MAG: hypothetical protein Q7K26_04885 [bacterium]|nr:hypothetical protein [bacterium]